MRANERQQVDLRLTGALLVEDGVVEGAVLVADGALRWAGPADRAPAAEAREQIDCGAGLIAPGFVDIHLHGGGGGDALEGTAAALATIGRCHAEHGTTAWCPTLLSAAPEDTLRALAAVRAAAERGAPGSARVLGAHLEGPFLAPAHAGAHPRRHLRRPDRTLAEEMLAAAGESLRLVTLAPELPGALDLVALLRERGVVVAIGHSGATLAEAAAAIERGCRLGTHLFNAMAPLHHREPGIAGAVLLDERVYAEVIADGVHLAPSALQLAWRLKREKLLLVSDCTAALGAGSGRLGDRSIHRAEGAARLEDGQLAGSVLTLERACANLSRSAGVPLEEALRAACWAPRVLLDARCDLWERGAPADLVVLAGPQQPLVQQVYVAGRRIRG